GELLEVVADLVAAQPPEAAGHAPFGQPGQRPQRQPQLGADNTGRLHRARHGAAIEGHGATLDREPLRRGFGLRAAAGRERRIRPALNAPAFKVLGDPVPHEDEIHACPPAVAALPPVGSIAAAPAAVHRRGGYALSSPPWSSSSPSIASSGRKRGRQPRQKPTGAPSRWAPSASLPSREPTTRPRQPGQ